MSSSNGADGLTLCCVWVVLSGIDDFETEWEFADMAGNFRFNIDSRADFSLVVDFEGGEEAVELEEDDPNSREKNPPEDDLVSLQCGTVAAL